MSEKADETGKIKSLYQQFLDEREEVLRHKWIRSEEAGHDIGLETALIDWTLNCREEWKKEYWKKYRSA